MPEITPSVVNLISEAIREATSGRPSGRYRVDAGPNAARKRARGTMAQLHN
jgi:hypothetical protein